MLDPDQAGFGGFGDLGTHLIDALLWLRPGHSLKVQQAQLATVARLGQDIGGSAVLAWDDRVPATVRTSWDTRPGGLHIVLQGTADTATIDDGTLALASGQSWTAEKPDANRALDAFVADLRGQTLWQAPSPSDAVRVAQLIDDAYGAAAKHRQVDGSGSSRMMS